MVGKFASISRWRQIVLVAFLLYIWKNLRASLLQEENRDASVPVLADDGGFVIPAILINIRTNRFSPRERNRSRSRRANEWR